MKVTVEPTSSSEYAAVVVRNDEGESRRRLAVPWTAVEANGNPPTKLIRLILSPTVDALTVVQFCAMIDPEHWESRAKIMAESRPGQNVELVEMAEKKLRAILAERAGTL